MEKKRTNKKFLLLIIGIILILVVIGGSFFIFRDNIFKKEDIGIVEESKEKKVATATPLLYEVTKDGEDAKIYLFGSIHVADDRAYPMQDKIMEAYRSSDYLAVELDLVAFEKDIPGQIEMLQMFLCEDGKTLKDYLSDESYEIIIQYMKDNGIYDSTYEMYKPGLIYTLIANVSADKSGLSSEDGIDMYFLKRATRTRKKILEVESAELQYGLLASMPDELYELMMIATIQSEEEEIESLKKLYEAWLSGDVEEILNNLGTDELDIDDIKKDLTLEEQAELDRYIQLINDFNESLIDERNGGMTSVVDTYFKEGKNVFVVVGTAHIVGDDGLVNELTELGYNVELIKYD